MTARDRARRIVVQPARLAVRGLVKVRTSGWPDHSRLFALGDRGSWSVEEDAEHLAATAQRLGFEIGPPRWAPLAERQSVFHASHFEALAERWLSSSHRLGTAYLHGRPGTPGFPEFDDAFATLRRHAHRIDRVQVTHGEMYELVVSAGIHSERVFRIPIGIDIEHFPLGDAETKAQAREALELPSSAFVVGSFQKDGVGWKEGLEPKLVKGPDVLVAVLERLREQTSDLFVLLTGPARGYVRHELELHGIPHRYVFARSRSELARAYHALDVYLVASRQEGGPKGVLESMATGTPLVTTRVGQAQELVEDGRNGLLAAVEDVEALAELTVRVAEDAGVRERLRSEGRATAEMYAHERLDAAWATLFDGFVERLGPAVDGR